MGLLDKLSKSGFEAPQEQHSLPAQDKPIIQKKSNSVGLLKKSMMASQYDKLDFFEFIQKYNFSLCSYLQLKDNSYCITKSFGFDGKSICQSYSTKDFWDGTIKEKNNLYSFQSGTSDILPFYQFFSDKLKDKIELLYIYKFDDDSIFLLVTDKFFTVPQTLIYDLQNTDFAGELIRTPSSEQNGTSFEYEINLFEAIESFVLANSKTNKLLINAISEQLFINLSLYFPKPDLLTKKEIGVYYLKIFCPQALPIELFTAHLQNQIKFVLDNHSELISIELLNNGSQAE